MNVSRRSVLAIAAVGGLVVALTAIAAAQNPPLKPIERLAPQKGVGELGGAPGAAGLKPIFRIPPNELIPEAVGLIADGGQQTDWGHAKINVPQAWAQTQGEGAVVAVLDTGIDSGHPDLKDQVIDAKNFTDSGTVLGIQGHGTHCAGIVAALDNDIGVVGVAPKAKLMNGKVLGDQGSGQMEWSAQGVDWAVDHGADVISMSLGSPDPFSALERAINRAVSKGVIVVCAAGNDGASGVGFPGKYEACVCVAAFDEQLNIAGFSSRGPEVDVAAPGAKILSLFPGGQVAVLSGTSMATPYVAGVAALYVSSCKKAGTTPTPKEFREILEKSSLSNNPMRPNPNSGFGRIQADQFVDPGTIVIPPPVTSPHEVTFNQSDFTTVGLKKLQDSA